MVFASEIATKLNLKLVGVDKEISGVSDPTLKRDSQLYWAKGSEFLEKISKGVVVVSDDTELRMQEGLSYLLTKDSPRLIFAKAVNLFFPSILSDSLINYVHHHKKNEAIIVGDYCFIGENVKIGKGTVIHPNTTIYSNTIIGENCIIMSNSSIGSAGIGFEYEGNVMYKFPQIGNVVLEKNVEIGPSTTVRRGALGSTIIKKYSKIGALSNVGHNCIIGENALLTGNCIIAGSTVIGKKAYLGVGAVIKNKVKIGVNATIGMGATVIHDIPNHEVWVGSPARKKSGR